MHRSVEKLEDINHIIISTKDHVYLITPDGACGIMETLSDYDIEPSEHYVMLVEKKELNINLTYDKIIKKENREKYND